MLFGAIVVVVFFLLRPTALSGGLATLGVVVALVAVAFVTFAVVRAGHTGATASWQDVVASTSGGGEGG
ncbi:MAG: hypothetical protein R2731_09950 [Nocardioides sp.]